ncbi:MAG: hypothetical protein JWM85_929, partial [Acidimicrobiaceae bacterium]|nr:hypothetical protein [Acidimicrobiaceae bacterium]
LAERSLRARVAGRPVRVLSVGPRLEAPSKEDASALFASLPTVSRAGARTTPGSILVVPDADRLRLADLVELLEPAEGGRATVVLMFGRNDASRDHGRFPARAALFEASRRVHSRERAEKTPSRSAAVALSESALLVDLRSRLSRAAKSDLGRDLGIGR